jgi:hypothetical protein
MIDFYYELACVGGSIGSIIDKCTESLYELDQLKVLLPINDPDIDRHKLAITKLEGKLKEIRKCARD